MILNNTEEEFIQSKIVEIFDKLIKNTVDDIPEEKRDSTYNELVGDVVFLVESVIDKRNNKLEVGN